MKRISVNLYKRDDKKEYEFFIFIKKFFPQVFLLFFIFITINIFLFIMSGFYSLNCKVLTAKWNKVSPQWQRIVSLKSEISSLESEAAAYGNLYDAGPQSSHILSDIYGALPKNIWFRVLNIRVFRSIRPDYNK